ncbi:MAG: hypothetical protein ABW082_13145 [Sedimenticola sp.]
MVTGPSSILHAWNSAAFNRDQYKLYFMGGGHRDYGGNGVYEFDLLNGKWSRLTDPSTLDMLFIAKDYNKRGNKPWRRLCWMPDTSSVPPSTHTYDGLVYSSLSKTVFLYSMKAANGSCIEDPSDDYKASEKVIGHRTQSMGLYEFNPDRNKERNGLAPLSWRKVAGYGELKKLEIHQGYPLSTDILKSSIIIGSKRRTVFLDTRNGRQDNTRVFSFQPDYGVGNMLYDKKRKIVWSLHKGYMLAYDLNSGRKLRKIKSSIPHGKSLAIASDGNIYSWNGTSKVSVFDPDSDPVWKTYEWGDNGPDIGNSRVYGKWVYLDKEGVFIGLTTHKTGVWVYKHPENGSYIEYSNNNIQKLVDSAKPGSSIVIPPGIYNKGLFIRKSMNLNLDGVSLRGIVGKKGVLNVKCNNCSVVIDNFRTDGLVSGCRSGNCAGIKAEGINFSLKVRDSHIKNTVMGILTDNRGGELIVENTLIEDTGFRQLTPEYAHGIYAGRIDTLIVKQSSILSPFGKGHIVKSRATVTDIDQSVLAGLDGEHSRIIDFPCGGELSVTSSVLQHGHNADNDDLMAVGTESRNCGGKIKATEVRLKNNWIIIDRKVTNTKKDAHLRLFTSRASPITTDVSSNQIISDKEIGLDQYGRSNGLKKNNRFFRSREEAGFDAGTVIPNQIIPYKVRLAPQ